ncbi:MAG: hypothetical protein EHM78_02130 [Myxococcaceae bacterium]|nr:MAG: hypothetical protein EHM78_02130 [Myxococcaceae bacterium]
MEKKYAEEAGIDKRKPHRIEDPETGKTKVVLGKVGFSMGLRRPGEPRRDPSNPAPQEPIPIIKSKLEG